MLAAYRALAAKATQMLDAASSGDWELFIEAHADYESLAGELPSLDTAAVELDAVVLQQKAELIRTLLAHDAAIRRLAEPWMSRLAAQLGSERQESKLRQAYDSSPSGESPR